MKNSLVILFLFINVFSFGQDLSLWSAEELNKCNTAKNENYLTDEEKKVIQLINLSRLDGQKFTLTIAAPFIKESTPTIYTKSLIKDLKIVKNYPLMEPNKEMYDIALNHAKKMGELGKIGHDKFAERVNHIRNAYNGVHENCDYGFDNAHTIVMRLLIDEGVSSLGHRKTILNPDIYYVGTSIQPHKKWGFNCVQVFGGKKF